MILRISHLPLCTVLACAWWVLGSTGCWGTPSASKAEPEASGTSTDAGTGDASPSTTTVLATSTGTTGALDDTRGTSGSEATGLVFLLEPDNGGVTLECNIFEQDCPKGEKCTSWANGGGNAWNATKCVPVVDDPLGVGEPCHVVGSGTSGIDDCELGAICFYVDPETLEGICMPFCRGDEGDPQCEDPSWHCDIHGDGSLVLCLPTCDPLLQDCIAGYACYPVGDEWNCALDASGEQGQYGDPCEFINVCDPGLACLDADTVPPGQACEGAAGCCTEVCDLLDPAGDLQCTGAAGGQVCVPWYVDGAAPPGYADVGVCALP